MLSVLALAALVNWFVFFGMSVHFGGDAIGVLPSIDGFVVTSHGRKTGVSESVWLFSLIYPYCTLMLGPAILLLFGARHKILHSAAPQKRWLLIVFLCIWAAIWYGAITKDFVSSINDYKSFKTPFIR